MIILCLQKSRKNQMKHLELYEKTISLFPLLKLFNVLKLNQNPI